MALTKSERYWNDTSSQYPHQAVIQRGVVDPAHWDHYGPHTHVFIACPTSSGFVLWGFQTKADRDVFCAWNSVARSIETPIKLTPSLDLGAFLRG